MSNNALEILKKRYFLPDEKTPEDMFKRVANFFGRGKFQEELYQTLSNLDFLPNSPTLMNAGTDIKNYSACFVLPIGDSMVEIFQAVKNAAIVSKTGGGVGLDFSSLRPKNSKVGSTGGVASGPVSFMEPFNAMVDCVKQGSKRRGALMGVLRVDHPDILEFVNAKKDLSRLTNFNISVAATDAFMKAVINNETFDLTFNGETYKTVKAIDIWNAIVENAWATGEPGIMFIDTINDHNPNPELGRITATNPCGEQPLLPYEACNLGSINLVNHYKSDGVYGIDEEKLEHTIENAMYLLNKVIEMAEFPLPEINEMVNKTRKIGLGVMGFADLCYLCGVRYGSEKSLKMASQIMTFISEIARINGDNNSTYTTIAPTGTISMIADCSSGIEPNFALVYQRYSTSLDETFYYTNRIFEAKLADYGIELTEELKQEILENGGSIQGIEKIPKAIRDVFVVAKDVTPSEHVTMQATWQVSGVDNAVSKTVNLPSSATIGDVKHIYMSAWDQNCKGVTVYRDGCRENQILSTSMPKNNRKETQREIKPSQRPAVVSGDTREVKVGCGKLYCTINHNENGLVETFVNTGAYGVCPGFSQGISRMISLAARSGINTNDIIDQLCSVSCRNCNGVGVKSCPDAIGRAIQASLDIDVSTKDSTQSSKPHKTVSLEKLCPDCGREMDSAEGCWSCGSCGYSRCS